MTAEQGGEQLAELEGPGGDGLYGAYLLDWIAVCDDLQDGDTRGYWTLRALVYEHRGVINRVRVLTMADMCQLITGPNKKPSSLTRVRGMLGRLSAVGLVSTPAGGPIKTSSRGSALGKPLRIKIHDRPCNGYVPHWKNIDDKLKAIQPQATQAARKAAEQEAAKALEARAKRAGRNSDPHPTEAPTGRNSDPLGRNSDPHPASDQQVRDPYSFPWSPSFSLLTPAAGVPDGTAAPAAAVTDTDERENAAPQNDNNPASPEPVGIGDTAAPVPAQRVDGAPTEPTGVEQVLAAYEQALGGPALDGTRAKLLAAAEGLLAVRPLWWVVDRARELPQWGDDLKLHAGKSKVPFTKPKPAARPQGVPPVDPTRKRAPMPAHIAALRASARAGQSVAPAAGPAVRPAPAPGPSAGDPVSGSADVNALLAGLASPNI